MDVKKQTILKEAYTPQVKRYTAWDFDTEFRQLCKYQTIANQFTRAHGLPGITVKFNGRLKKALGMFTTGREQYIDLNKEQAIMDYRLGTDLIVPILIHELTHFQVKCEGGNYDDGAYDFEHALAVNGASSSGTTREAVQQTSVALHYHYAYDLYTATDALTGAFVGNMYKVHTIKESYHNGRFTMNGVPVNLKRTGFVIQEVEQIIK